jgi:hypothetical protein
LEIEGNIVPENIMPEWMIYFTFAAAMLGAILGIIKLWKSINRDKIKLKVIPRHAIPVGSTDSSIIGSIEVINLSLFTITLSEIGLSLKDTEERLQLINPLLSECGKLPMRLEAKASITAFFFRSDIANCISGIKCAYACTVSGEKFNGNSPALRQISRSLMK